MSTQPKTLKEIEIPKGALQKLRARQNEIDRIARDFELQFQQRAEPIRNGMNDMTSFLNNLLEVPDAPHMYDLQRGVIRFDVEIPEAKK